MTHIAVLADIHGNLPALEAVIEDMAQFEIDHVIVAGDVINWGPFSAAVVARVHASGWAVIRGNNEFYLLDYQTDRAPVHWQEYAMIPWLHQQLQGRWQNVIAAWPDALSLRFPDAPSVHVCHGSPRSPWESIHPETSAGEIIELVADVEETTLIAGHTHLVMERQVDRWHILNPGSVGIALDGVPGARYMLLEAAGKGWSATFRHVEYDSAPLFEAFERQHFVEQLGVTGHLVIEEFKTARLHLYPFMLWRAEHHPDEPISMTLLEQFASVDKWAYTPPAFHVNRDAVKPENVATPTAIP